MFQKAKKVLYVLVPVIIVVAVGTKVIQYIKKSKEGEEQSVSEAVEETVNMVRSFFKILNG